MEPDQGARFGEYIEILRRERCRSIRETAIAIGVSSQFSSAVEKGRRSTGGRVWHKEQKEKILAVDTDEPHRACLSMRSHRKTLRLRCFEMVSDSG